MSSMSPTQQDILRASLEKTTEAFFRRRSKLIVTLGNDAPKIDATGLLGVLSGWVGDLIAGAPEGMRDALFMSFADTAATVAGIKAEDEAQSEQVGALQ